MYIYDAKVRWSKGIATRNEQSREAAQLGFLKQEDVITCAGIEECDHAHWIEHPDKFKERFGMTLKEYASGLDHTKQVDYNTDPLEQNATALKHKAKREMRFDSIQLG